MAQGALKADDMLIKEEAKQEAERLLEIAWWSDPGAGIPIDPVQIARRLGIDVFEVSLDREVSGALIKGRGQDPEILLNATDSSNRKRFTCAHELGHFVRRSDNLHEYEYIDFRDQLSSTGTDHEEMYANSFAANLLMPEDIVKRYRSRADDVELALLFDVSREAMNNRLKNL
jgi:Zn-dependent peptidase ImmA (M78 family)